MAGNKTIATDDDVMEFIEAVEDEGRRRDAFEMTELMRKVTGREPVLWKSSLVGFGSYHYRYESGREGDFFLTGFSPRKSAFTIYIMPGFDRYGHLLEKLGPHRTGKSCLYVRNLDAIDRDVLEELVRASVRHMREKYECS